MSRIAGRVRDDQAGPLKCPKCSAAMEKVTFEAITVDRCTSCRGLWFDAREHERLKNVGGAEDIDLGKPKAEDRGTKVKINCPVCHTQLIRMVDHQQPHVWFESCTVCHGVFFDAGEFRDYKDHTVAEWFKGRKGKERR